MTKEFQIPKPRNYFPTVEPLLSSKGGSFTHEEECEGLSSLDLYSTVFNKTQEKIKLEIYEIE